MSLSELKTLLADLVRTPSVSGTERMVAEKLEQWASGQGLSVVRNDAGVVITVDGNAPGPTLWLASHLDTVPPGEGWVRDPFAATIEDGVLHGRGASDAKASVAAMAFTARGLARRGGPPRGRLRVVATYGEETASTTMPAAVQQLGPPDAAIVGEPTSLEPCVAQRGLLIVRLRWSGTAGHAGWAAAQPGEADNAIEKAAHDLARLSRFRFVEKHSVLGPTAATITRIEGGIATNVVPDSCIATLDIRTTPLYSVHDVLATIALEAPFATIELVSQRFLPCETPGESRLWPVIREARPSAQPFGSPTASDWVFLRDVDTVKLGPGDSRLSHTTEERVSLIEVEEAARLYEAVAWRYLS